MLLGVKEKLGLKRQVCAVKNCRNIGKKDMKNNDTMAEIEVNPETYEVKVDGQPVSCEAAKTLPMAQLYYMF